MLKEFTNYLIDRAVNYLQSLKNDQEKDNWSIYLIHTKSHTALIAAKDGYTGMIPEDGSFLGGYVIHSGLTEDQAKSTLDFIIPLDEEEEGYEEELS